MNVSRSSTCRKYLYLWEGDSLTTNLWKGKCTSKNITLLDIIVKEV